MTTDANPYRFGDMLALARQSWVHQMAARLAGRGYPGYRLTDAATLRRLRAGTATVGQLARPLGITRQAARKIVRGLEERGYATTRADPADARKLNISLTAAGTAYADAITDVIAALNRAIAARVPAHQLAAADAVLRASIDDQSVARLAAHLTPPPSAPA